MPVMRTTSAVVVWCVLLLVGCRGDDDLCPKPKLIADPQQIPSGESQTELSVEVNGFSGFETVTVLSSVNGTITDPFARQTTYTCAYDVSGPVEICVDVTYTELGGGVTTDAPGVAASAQYLKKPHVRLPDPLVCSESACTTVICPADKNACPVMSSFTVDPAVLSEGETAALAVTAEDPDGNPEPLSTTFSAAYGTIANPTANPATYSCDPNVGGAIEVCVLASDGDSACDVERCTTIRCPGEPLENTCPIIEDLTASPNPIPLGAETATIRVDVTDPDAFPEPLATELTSDGGAFVDRSATETVFRCAQPGPVEVCVEATDGDAACNKSRCITVQCPSDIRVNLCPQLFVINAIPSTIALGQTSTAIETRGQDTDGLPLPLVLTLSSLWGSFENTINIPEPNNVVAQNATYVCDRPGPVEVCVEATDGACVKTLCADVNCPPDIPPP